MRINKFKFSLLSLFTAIATYTSVSADTINCKDSFAPRFLCESYADWTNNFSINTIVRMFTSILIAVLVLYVLFQIVKAVFSWINKSNDDKSRGAAIKSISNAVVGGIVVLLVLVATFIFTNIVNTGDTPNPLYACYASNSFADNEIDAGTGSLTNGTAKQEISNSIVYERKSTVSNIINDKSTAETYALSVNETAGILYGTYSSSSRPNSSTKSGSFKIVGTPNKDLIDFMQNNLYCGDRNTGKEHPTGYVILKRVGVNK